MKKNIKKENGITLIALVITIVVSLILVGSTVSLFSNEGGFLSSISGIKQESRLQLNEVSADTEKDIEDSMDNKIGAIETNNSKVEFYDTFTWRTFTKLELKLNDYSLVVNDKSYDFDIQYNVRKRSEQSYNESTYKSGDESKYNCKIELDSNEHQYTAGAFAYYKDEEGNYKRKLIKETDITTPSYKWNIGDWVNYDAGVWSSAEIKALGDSNLYHENYQEVADDIKMAPLDYNGNGKVFDTYKYKFSGMTVNKSKNIGLTYTKTSYSGVYSWRIGSGTISGSNEKETDEVKKNTATLGNGWRIMSIDDTNAQISLVSAGIPEYFIGRCIYNQRLWDNGNGGQYYEKYYVPIGNLKAIKERDFSQYLDNYEGGNNFAESARIMSYRRCCGCKK